MTYDLKKNFLYSSPDKIAKIIYKKLKLGQDIIYAPYFWKLIMLIIKIIPEKLFKKLNF